MIVVGTPWCAYCKKYRESHPGVVYVEIHEHVKERNSLEWKVKQAVFKLKVRGFPAMLSDDLTQFLGFAS